MSQKSISSFFSPKPKPTGTVNSSSPGHQKNPPAKGERGEEVGAPDREETAKENVPANEEPKPVRPVYDPKVRPTLRPSARRPAKPKADTGVQVKESKQPNPDSDTVIKSASEEKQIEDDKAGIIKEKEKKYDNTAAPVASIFNVKSKEEKPTKSPPKRKSMSPKTKSPAKIPKVVSSPVKSVAVKDESDSPISSSSRDEKLSPKAPSTPAAGAASTPAAGAASIPAAGAGSTPTRTPPAKKNPFQNFFTPKSGGGAAKVQNECGQNYADCVRKSVYNPIDDCFWARGEKTPYLALANTLLAIEETSGRLRTIEILSNYFRSVIVQTPDDLLPSIYLTLNRLAPAWDGLELGIGDSFLMKAIANTTGRTVAQVKADAAKLGDLGIVAETSRGSQRTMFQPAILTVQAVFGRLKEIGGMTGTASGQKKTEKIQSLLVACRGSEARYLIRSLAGKLRIGLAEQSVLQALAQACVQTPLLQTTDTTYPPPVLTAYKSIDSDSFKERLAAQSLLLKTAYCECPTYDLLVPALLAVGIDGLSGQCRLTPGIPLKPMLAHPTKGVQEVLTRFENSQFTCEWKYDGERAQVHMEEDGGRITIYSRNQEDNTTKFPEVIRRFSACLRPGVASFVLDAEAVAWDREHKTIQPFQILSTRKRKDAVESEIKVQVCLFAFDLLYLNGESLVRRPFQERRQLLYKNFVEVAGEFAFAKAVDGTTTEEIQEALEESIRDNCEGLMVKTLDVEATYEIARRSRNWLKLKKDYLEGVGDTIDLVVIGGYLGKGKRTGGYGGFLLACYDPDNEEYQTICKIGTGFSDEDLQQHAAYFQQHVVDKPKGYYAFDPSHAAPDHWFEPVQVWEVKCADLSISPVHKAAVGIVDPAKGVSLRFPRFIRVREDKGPEDATSAEQIAEMYRSQDVIKNQNKGGSAAADEEFDF